MKETIIGGILWIVIVVGSIGFANWSFEVWWLPMLENNALVEYHQENHQDLQGTYKVCQKCKNISETMKRFNKAHTE